MTERAGIIDGRVVGARGGSSIREGLWIQANDPADADIIVKAGATQVDGDFPRLRADANLTVEAAAAGKLRLDIVQGALAVPSEWAVKKGTEITAPVSASYVPGLAASTSSGWTTPIYPGNMLRNTSGGDQVVARVEWNFTDPKTSVKVQPYYIVSATPVVNNSATPVPTDWTALESRTVTVANSVEEWAVGVTVPNNYYFCCVFKVYDQVGGSARWGRTNADITVPVGWSQWGILYPETADMKWNVTATYAHGGKSDGSCTWTLDSPSVDPAYPSPDSGKLTLAQIGTVDTPIDDSFTTVVDETPGAGEVVVTDLTGDYR